MLVCLLYLILGEVVRCCQHRLISSWCFQEQPFQVLPDELRGRNIFPNGVALSFVTCFRRSKTSQNWCTILHICSHTELERCLETQAGVTMKKLYCCLWAHQQTILILGCDELLVRSLIIVPELHWAVWVVSLSAQLLFQLRLATHSWRCKKPHNTVDFHIFHPHTSLFMLSMPILVFHWCSSNLMSVAGHCCVHMLVDSK